MARPTVPEGYGYLMVRPTPDGNRRRRCGIGNCVTGREWNRDRQSRRDEGREAMHVGWRGEQGARDVRDDRPGKRPGSCRGV